MDVGIVTAPLDYGPSGPNVYLRNLCNELAHIDQDDIDLHFIHYQESDDPIYDDVHDVILARSPILFEYQVANLGLDILHYNYIPYKRPLVFGLPMKKVVTVHGDLPLVLPEQSSWKRRNIQRNILKTFAKTGLLDQIDAYLTVSKTLAENVHEHLDIPERKLHPIYSGINDRFSPVSNPYHQIEEKYGITGPYLLNVNNYMEKKNRRTLLKAMVHVLEQKPDLSLVLAGGGWEDSGIDEMIRQLDLKDAVIDLGFVPDEDLPLLYSGAEALVNPTLHETFGLTNVEAMACGCPVVTSNRFSVPEIVGDAATLISDPKNPQQVAQTVLNVVTDDQRREESSKRGRKRAAEFSWEECAGKVIDVYRELMGQ